MEDPADARAIRLPKGMTVEALWEARQALVQNPTPEGLKHLARQIFDVQQYVAGERLVLDVMAADQDNLPLLLAGADLLANYTTRYDVVVAVLAKVLAALPHLSELKVFMAAALVAKGDVALGLRVFADIMQNHPEHHVAACEHLAVALLEVGYMQEGHTVLDTWFRDNKPVTAALLNNMGCVLQRLNRSEEALPWYRRALELQPDNAGTIMGYAVALFKAGHYAQGAPYYAGREGLVEDTVSWYRALPRMEKNTSLHGRKVILFQDQGLGDTLQFIRYLPMVQARGALVTVVVPTGLVRLLTLSFPQAQVVAEKDFAPQDGYDLGLPIPDLPFVMGLRTPADIIANIPYLLAPPADVARFAALLGAQRPRIGLVWAGSRRTKPADVLTDQRRSATLEQVLGAITPVDAALVNLQFAPRREDLAAWNGQPVCDLMDHVQDMADTAAIIDNLDLVISVDTSVVHLAGALGKPAWLLSRWDGCWRWGDSGETSPWYPNMRIFRAQERSFAPVLEQMGQALRTWVATWQPGKGELD
ncbi:glycosyltransferase family 9 protein [Acetobacter lambici]|uniref:Tetratricopeptide repeat protein n=2 Tax=Acetobacter lambici TaxID=1332824 RepID=A0ABT1EY48_9PROT|nr:tetratricopeptide repeat protein [Acetobacter lambici]MCP1257808.1 tetratricopeptide repeat protein [Acetobacter lambici]